MGKDLEKRGPLCAVGGHESWLTIMENAMKGSQLIKNRTSNSTTGDRAEGNRITVSKIYLYFHVYHKTSHNI